VCFDAHAFKSLQHSKHLHHAFKDIKIANPPQRSFFKCHCFSLPHHFVDREVPLDLLAECDGGHNPDINKSLDHILHPSSVAFEMQQLTQVSNDWEILGHTTEAGVGLKVRPSFNDAKITAYLYCCRAG
jgi:hypothetical protein